MMKHTRRKRLAALALCVLMFLGQLPTVAATSHEAGLKVTWKQVDNDQVTAEFLPEGDPVETEPAYGPEDTVRVSIILAKKPTLSVYGGGNVAKNTWAVSYRQALEQHQEEVAAAISAAVLDNRPLDVVWNLTLAANAISANVPYGSVEQIRQVPGVADVFLEQQYSPCVTESGTYDPKMQIATGMTDTTQAWADGYTGAGSRVAIVDTGLDIDHKSVDDGAFLYSLGLLAQEADMTLDAYTAQKDLLDLGELSGTLTQLNAYRRSYYPTQDYYISAKIPFGFNYVDANRKITHMTDTVGDHGSHVAGIAAANRFLPQSDGTYASAMDTVGMVGAAPDAQILVMKVFGEGGGAYESDYMAAVEDAVLLDCDTVNLSLGSPNPGITINRYYGDILKVLERSGTVAAMAASNSGYWSSQTHTPTGLIYGEDVMFQTTGTPSTYSQSLNVASVDNDGMVSRGFYVPDRKGHFTAYKEPSGYGRKTLGSLDTDSYGNGTAYDYIWVDGIGTAQDYSGIDLTGKVVFCARGTTTFTEKLEVVTAKGALALVVYNNVPGSFSMNLDSYGGTVPCVSITQADGMAIRQLSQDQGSHRTGRILITGTVAGNDYGSDYYTMSSFSSWGVPGDLSIKPEITAPGGNIWSLKGIDSTHDQYQVMGGTSMAAPQVAGIGALVQQAIEERGLSCSGLSRRALTQSLLMSTAVPMKDADGDYYPILQQGAGLVNAGAATSADSCITVAGMADGKVKVELGDDPSRSGSYPFTFTVHNLDGVTRSYDLRADVFTQDILHSDGFAWMNLNTQPLADATAAFYAAETLKWDFDGNGVEEQLPDGQALLAYASGHRDFISCRENADLSGDGEITTYDAHLFLNRETNGDDAATVDTVTVPAGGTAEVTVNITLDKSEMEKLLQDCPNGVYIQAYVFADARADAEGAVGTSHSIPVVGFYGNWTDSSMYDKGSYQYYHYRLHGDSTPYTPYLGSADVNSFMVSYSSNKAMTYVLGGNPLTLYDKYGTPAQLDREYLESRNALNNTVGDMVHSLRHTAIRNSVATRFTAVDANTGVVYVDSQTNWDQLSAYYNPNSGTWEATNYSPYLGWAGTDWNGWPLPENTVVNLCYTRAPEYYVNSDGSVRWADLGEGASFRTQVTIDNTAPRLIDASAANKDLTVTVHDNQYVAAVVLLDSSGQQQLSFAGGNQMRKDIQTDVILHVDDVVGKTFMLQLYDYAMNVSTFQVTVEGMESAVDNYYTGYSRDDKTWYGVAQDGTAGAYALDSRDIYAAERVEDLVFAVDSTQDNTANLYVMPADDLAKIETVGVISSPKAGETFYIADMAYHYPERTMYFVYSCSHSDYRGCYGLATVDLLTGQVDFDSYGPLGVDLRGLAIDESGTFYGVGDNYQLYTYTAGTYAAPQATGIALGSLTGSPTRVSLTWDGNKDELVMADHRSAGRTLYTVNPQTGALTTVSASAPGTLWGLHVDSGLDSGQNFSATDVPTHVFMAEDSVKILLNGTYALDAYAYPWTLTDRSVIYSSSNSSIASVDSSGQITGNSIGTCVITATSRLNPSISARCSVEVTNIKAELTALIGQGGQSYWSAFHTETLSNYQTTRQSPNKLVCATSSSDGWIYGATWLEHQSSTLYRVDPNTLEEKLIGTAYLREYTYPLVDLADAPNLGSGNQYLLGISQEAARNSIVILDRSTGAIVGVVNNQMGLTSQLTGITYAGKLNHPQKGTFDTYYALDYDGNIYWVGMQVQEVSAEGLLTLSLIGKTADYRVLETKRNTDYVDFYNSLHYTRDSSGTPMLFWSYYRWRSPIQILAIDADKTGTVEYLGTFPSDVTFAGGLMDGNTIAVSQVSADDVTVVQTDVNDLEAFYAATAQRAASPAAADLFPRSSASAVTAAPKADTSAIAAKESGSGKNVVLELRTGKTSTNGLLRITYDPKVLTFEKDTGTTLLYSGKKETDGTVTLGYAQRTALGAEQLLSELEFTAKAEEFETEITVTVLEDGAQTNVGTQVKVPVRRMLTRYKVTFDLNGGEGTAPTAQNVVAGQKAAAPADPSRGGYRFLYWSASKNGSSYSFGSAVTGDLTLYAIWEALPTEPTEPETQPTEATEPETKPSEPETQPTEPETKPTEPETQPTEPETKPTEPETQPTEPETKPTQPETRPTEPTKPTEPKPTEPEKTECPKDHTCPLAAFDDVIVGDWYHDGIHFCVEQKIMNGMGEGKFAPNDNTTRAQLVTMLYRLAGEPSVEGKEEPFTDVTDTDWFYAPIVWAFDNKVVNGVTATEFAPNASITREQVATILYRYLGEPEGTGNLEEFPDVADVSAYAVAPLTWAVGEKLITGIAQPDGTAWLAPTGNATRAQIATILMRYLTK